MNQARNSSYYDNSKEKQNLSLAEPESSAEEISQNPKGSLFSISAISSHLLSLGYDSKSLSSMIRCGSDTHNIIMKQCGCGVTPIVLKHHCNLRTCPECAIIRKKRLRKRYLPLLKKYHQDRQNFFYFLTISPQNYTDLSEGISHLRSSFTKFLRLKYVKERIKGSIYVLEVTGSDGDWHVHLHAIVFGRWLDNRMRGLCLDCGQSLMKYDYFDKKFYCASSKCLSKNVIVKEDSKIVTLFKMCSSRECNIHIQRQATANFTLNYMLKYVSANKDSFSDDFSMAKYIFITHKQRLITTNGIFYDFKFVKTPCMCSYCGERVSFIFDMQLMELFRKSMQPPDPNLLSSYV